MSGESNQRMPSGSFSRAERGRGSLEHTWIAVVGCILSPPGSTGEGELTKDLGYTFFLAALGRCILKEDSNVGKFRLLI